MKYNNVLITGGSSGIGLDLAKAYSKQQTGRECSVTSAQPGTINSGSSAMPQLGD